MSTYLERYAAGEHEQVWKDLQALGDLVQEEPLSSDAYAVARETMLRVRHNIETLVPRLEAVGYRFGDVWHDAMAREGAAHVEAYRIEHTRELIAGGMSPDDPFFDTFNRPGSPAPPPPPDPIFTPPSPNVAAQTAELEALRGALPMSVRAWFEFVGHVNFIGLAPEGWCHLDDIIVEDRPDHTANTEEDQTLLALRKWSVSLDPIYLHSVKEAVKVAEFDEAELRGEFGELPIVTHASVDDPDKWEVRPLRDSDIRWYIAIGAGMWEKYEYSGGGYIQIRVPDTNMDGELMTDNYAGRFVEYLRLCFSFGGLPGLHLSTTGQQEDEWARDISRQANWEQIRLDLRYLTEGLLPF